MADIRKEDCPLDLEYISKVRINYPSVVRSANRIASSRPLKQQWQAAWLLKAVTCLDLTTLSGNDIRVGAVCVYPARITECVQFLQEIGRSNIPVAAVATGFPSGQYHLTTRLEEIRLSVADGAKEIDIVINRPYVLCGNWQGVYDEVKAMKKACGSALMKTILATGELGSLTNVYKASLVCMMAGADFIKTSTGKEDVNAILPVGLVMVRAIRDFYNRSNIKVGFKPAGGIRTAKDALIWLTLIKEELGDEWLTPNLFRIGASGVLGDIERQLFHFVTGRYAAINEFSTT
uniref:deoxyribose-phosphate aldolase n=1 Tax=Strigamia maritima TaxID=126957 RepID=T1J759_STRMM